MKREETEKTHRKLNLKLHRETLLALQPADLAQVVAGASSECRSGRTCCFTC